MKNLFRKIFNIKLKINPKQYNEILKISKPPNKDVSEWEYRIDRVLLKNGDIIYYPEYCANGLDWHRIILPILRDDRYDHNIEDISKYGFYENTLIETPKLHKAKQACQCHKIINTEEMYKGYHIYKIVYYDYHEYGIKYYNPKFKHNSGYHYFPFWSNGSRYNVIKIINTYSSKVELINKIDELVDKDVSLEKILVEI